MKCTWHLCNNELPAGRKKYCGDKCKNKASTTDSKRRNKIKLVEHFGGKCVECGYSKSVAALQFHHPDPNKEFGLGTKQTYAFAKQIEEASKCVLLCANCHAEAHWLQ